ncbi:hypothetical protein RE428_35100 [Marinobacter nanhaiticus D15-8W]|nr:hypothetical protein RE428_35100 [Marinobacter nanhaiticus D15-8W]
MWAPCETEPDAQSSESFAIDVPDQERVDQDNGICVVSGVRWIKFQEREMTEEATIATDTNGLGIVASCLDP